MLFVDSADKTVLDVEGNAEGSRGTGPVAHAITTRVLVARH